MQQPIQMLPRTVVGITQLIKRPENCVQICENFRLPRRAVTDSGKDQNESSGGQDLECFDVEAATPVLGLESGQTSGDRTSGLHAGFPSVAVAPALQGKWMKAT